MDFIEAQNNAEVTEYVSYYSLQYNYRLALDSKLY